MKKNVTKKLSAKDEPIDSKSSKGWNSGKTTALLTGSVTPLLTAGMLIAEKIKQKRDQKKLIAASKKPKAKYGVTVKTKSTTMKKGGTAIPKGYHKMPDGTIMKDSAHKKTKKKK